MYGCYCPQSLTVLVERRPWLWRIASPGNAFAVEIPPNSASGSWSLCSSMSIGIAVEIVVVVAELACSWSQVVGWSQTTVTAGGEEMVNVRSRWLALS